MDGQNKYGIGNGNSISIEMCINKDNNFDITVAKTIELTKYLMKMYNIPSNKVVRHYDASRKNCPQTFNNNGDWSKWFEFKSKLTEQSLSNTQLNDNLDYLKSLNIINSVDYWKTNATQGKTCQGEFVQILINNIVKYLKK